MKAIEFITSKTLLEKVNLLDFWIRENSFEWFKLKNFSS
jgi:hypothetical protein